MEFLINLAFIVVMSLIGLVVGGAIERRHYRSIREREQALKHVLLFNEKRPPLTVSGQPFHIVLGSVVVSSCRFPRGCSPEVVEEDGGSHARPSTPNNLR